MFAYILEHECISHILCFEARLIGWESKGSEIELKVLWRRLYSGEKTQSEAFLFFCFHSCGVVGAGEQSGRQRGPWGKLWTFLSAYPALIITVVILVLRCLPWCMRWMRLQSGLLGPIMDVSCIPFAHVSSAKSRGRLSARSAHSQKLTTWLLLPTLEGPKALKGISEHSRGKE